MDDLKQFEPLWDSWYIKELVGEGGFGKVFRIEREEFGNKYIAALKHIRVPQSPAEIKSILADGMTEKEVERYYENFVEDIVKEFVLMSKLKGNSNIVSYEDHKVVKAKGKIEWDIFIRMELLTSLIDHISKNNIRKKDVIQLGIDICKALEICQKYNIIHRDIKPENIFVSATGQFKLGDFGIARQIEKTSSALSKKGTFTYIAPEVYKGEPYGSTVDIYSLGIVMYRLLNNNRTPFMPPYPNPITHSNREAALVKRMSGEAFEKPINADGRLAEIVLTACAYNPKDRYENPTVMRKALEMILYNEEEASIIYPKGDVADIKSIKYISTGREGETLTIADTETHIMPMIPPKEASASFSDEKSREKSYAPASYEIKNQPKLKNKLAAALICAAVLGIGIGGFALYKNKAAKNAQENESLRLQQEEIKKQQEQIKQEQLNTKNALAKASYEKIAADNPYYSYLIYDIDKDGLSELLIGGEGSTGYGVNVYRFSDDNAVKLGTIQTYIDAFENKYIFDSDDGIGFVNKNEQKTEYGVWKLEDNALKYSRLAYKTSENSENKYFVGSDEVNEEEYTKFIKTLAAKKFDNYIQPREKMPEPSSEEPTQTTPQETPETAAPKATQQTQSKPKAQTTQKATQTTQKSQSTQKAQTTQEAAQTSTPAPEPEPTPEPQAAQEPEPVVPEEAPQIYVGFD